MTPPAPWTAQPVTGAQHAAWMAEERDRAQRLWPIATGQNIVMVTTAEYDAMKAHIEAQRRRAKLLAY